MLINEFKPHNTSSNVFLRDANILAYNSQKQKHFVLFATIWFVCKSNIILQMRRDSPDSVPDKLAYHRASASLEKEGSCNNSCMQYYCINLSS